MLVKRDRRSNFKWPSIYCVLCSNHNSALALNLVFYLKTNFFQLAEVPGVAHGNKKKFTPRLPMSVHKKFQSIRSSRLASFRDHMYECLVLLYRRYGFSIRTDYGFIILTSIHLRISSSHVAALIRCNGYRCESAFLWRGHWKSRKHFSV